MDDDVGVYKSDDDQTEAKVIRLLLPARAVQGEQEKGEAGEEVFTLKRIEPIQNQKRNNPAVETIMI
jgi:hypothetical protein